MPGLPVGDGGKGDRGKAGHQVNFYHASVDNDEHHDIQGRHGELHEKGLQEDSQQRANLYFVGWKNERNTSKGKRNRTNRTDFCIKHSSGRELIVPTAFPKEKTLSFSQKRYNATSIRFIKIAIGKVQNDHLRWKVCLTSELFLL